MKKFKEFLVRIFKSDTFLKILSLLIAVVFWLYIVTIADSEFGKTYQDVPVTFAYEGTVPYNSGLMPLVTSRSYDVAVRASGQRVDLMNFSKEEIQVSFDFSRINKAGTYKVPLIVSTNDPAITVEIVGDDEITMTFTERATVNLSVTFRKDGNYASGYEEINKLISPKTISVEGPKDIVEKISFAEVQIPVSNKSESFSELSDILLLTADRVYVDRTYLTISSTTANVEVELAYRNSLKVQATPVNKYGGNEESYTTITYSSPYVLFQGEPSLFTTGILFIGDIALEDIKTQTATKSYKIIPPEGLTCVDDIMEIEVTVDMGGSIIKNTKIPSSAIRNCFVRNVPEGKKATVTPENVYVSLRALPYVHENPNVNSWSYYVDLNDTMNSDGKYPLHIIIPSDVPAGLLSQAYVYVLIEDAE